MAHLRSVDVKILQQLLAVHEGIEAVKWLLEERSTLTSRCSSLTSSQYSLGEGPDTSWRGSWSSLQDPNDKLDNISIGSYLDTLADDMDEYCPSSSESVICSTTPLVSEATAGVRTAGGPGASVTAAGTGAGVGLRSGAGAGSGIRAGESENGTGVGNRMEVKGGQGAGVTSAISGTGISGTGTGKTAVSVSSPQAKSEGPKQDHPVWTKAAETGKGSPVSKGKAQTQAVKANGILEKPSMQTGSPTRPILNEKLGTSQSPKLKPYKNGKIDLDTCKMNGKMHLEYDAHWRWVQSQEDVTFL
ncbi:Leucine rich adaptor protein 1 Leucine repeat adapter protein 35A [Larimichthys crocea]|uniref:Leucine rich adaptor protein 1 Leucine repeat adapter protein 35A n=1 Tax=Larimichthys crocea TaxID=215358 RepID=A0A6G0IRP6_LARCR|nr:Leucine rich adaptor protein 1 Leucine repeat adapter protein 35A [Larimichthys crocea]